MCLNFHLFLSYHVFIARAHFVDLFPVLCFCQLYPFSKKVLLSTLPAPSPTHFCLISLCIIRIIELLSVKRPLCHLIYLLILLGFKHLKKNHLARLFLKQVTPTT